MKANYYVYINDETHGLEGEEGRKRIFKLRYRRNAPTKNKLVDLDVADELVKKAKEYLHEATGFDPELPWWNYEVHCQGSIYSCIFDNSKKNSGYHIVVV